MGLARTVVVSRIEPALLSVRAPAGVDLDLALSFVTQARDPVDPATLLPQLTLLPRSARQTGAYDVDNTGAVTVPGSALTDPAGYTLELYQRRVADNPSDPPVATGLLAKGVLMLDAAAYGQLSPLAPIQVPTVIGPVGPQGPQGIEGPQGVQGVQGPQGIQGIQGIKGDKGDQGIQGIQGPQGIQGVPGPANVLTIGTVTTGAPGSAASATITGVAPNQTISFVIPRGDVGAQGIQGIQGIQGPAGAPAINLRSGAADPTSGDGVVGDFWVNLTTGSLFGPKAASGTIWPVVKLTTYWA